MPPKGLTPDLEFKLLSRFFIQRPIFASVISIVIILVGLVSLGGLPIAEYPNLSPPMINVTALYPGADAEVISNTVASPIEQEVNGVEGMLYMSSTCSGDGTYTLSVTFQPGVDLDIASVQVQNRVSAAEPSLPEEVRRLGITTQKQMPDFAQMISVTSPDGDFDDVFLSNFATLNLRDPLKRIDGVGDVMVFGAADYAMRVWIDPAKLEARNITVSEVLNAIKEQNVQVAAGKIGAPPTEPDVDFQYTVTTKGRLTDPEEFGEIIVRTDRSGRILRLNDLARIELGAKNYTMESGVDGTPASVLAIYQLPGANLINISNAISAELESLSSNFPEGVKVAVTYDASLVVRASIAEILTTLFIATILVILTVLVFLQDFRATIVPAVTIPVSLIGTFTVLSALGFSLNTLSLFGLVLAIGIVVDDAIVVVENVARNLDHGGMSPKKAAVVAMEEVTGPVIATTLVLLAVFVPTSFMGGMVGIMYKQFALTIAAATVFSSINALTLSPALCGVLMRKSTGKKNPLFRLFNAVIEKSTSAYSVVVKHFVRKLALAMLVFVIVSVAGVLGFGELKKGFVPAEDKAFAMAVCMLPDAASRERTREVTKRIETIIDGTEGVQSAIRIEGYSLIDGVANPNVASFIIVLDPWDERTTEELSQRNIVAGLQRKLLSIQEARVFAFETPPVPGVGFVSGLDMQVQDRGGLGVKSLQEAASEFARVADSQAGLTGMNSTFRAGVPQIFVDVDRDKVKQMGLSLQEVFTSLQTNLGGTYVNDFNSFNRTYQVQVQAEASSRAHPEDILELRLRGPDGRTVPLGALASVEERFGPSMISRFNLYPTASVRGQPAPGYSSGQGIELMEQIANERLPQSMGYEWTGLAYQQKNAGGLGVIFGLAILLVYLVLAAQYESWSLPVAVLLAVPLGFIGVAAGALARDFDNNVYTQIGIVLLVALISKNAILIVEFALAKREEGLSPADAAIESARLRFRPILMTAFSFVLGTFPLVVATGAGAGARTALGTAVFCGLLGATILGVLITPALYRLVQGTAEKFGGGRTAPPGGDLE